MKVGDVVMCNKTYKIGIVEDVLQIYSSWGEPHIKVKWFDGKKLYHALRDLKVYNEHR